MHRRLVIERLSDRYLLAGDLTALYDPLDVNGDGQISASDAVTVINWMGRTGRSMRADSLAAQVRDVDGSGFITARDALLIINRIGNNLPFLDLRLANDTGSGGTTNVDRVTSDATIQGRLVAPPRQTNAVFSLRGISNLDDERSLELGEFMNGDSFEVPSSRLQSLLRSTTANASDAFKVELVAHDGDAFADDALVLASLEFVYDIRGPELLLPSSLGVTDAATTLTILEPSGVTADSLSTLGIRQPTPNQSHEGPARVFQTRIEEEAVFVDLALEQFGLTDDQPLRLQIDGTLEDLAGNRTTLRLQRLISRFPNLDDPAALPVEAADLRPDIGQAFDETVATVRAGQLIAVQIPNSQAVSPYSFKTVDQVNGGLVKLESYATYPTSYHTRTGVLTIRVPDDAISGPVFNYRGETIFNVNVIPDNRILPGVNHRVWDFDPSSASMGGIDVDSGEFYFRVFNSDDLSDPVIDEAVTREQVSDWSVIRDGNVATHGFATAQIAGPFGVSGPIEVFEARPDVESDIGELVLTEDGSAFWLAAQRELRRVDYLTGESTATVRLDTLMPPDVRGKVKGLHLVPAGAFSDRVQYAVPPPDPATPVLAVRVTEISGPPWLLLDSDDGTLIGRVSDVVDSLDADFLAETVYNPVRNSWLQVWRDGSRWREISLADGSLIGEGNVADTIPDPFIEFFPKTVRDDDFELAGGVLWDPEVESVRLLLQTKPLRGRTTTGNRCAVEPRISCGPTPIAFDFDPSAGGFVYSDSTLKHDQLFSRRLGRIQLHDEWLFRQANSFAAFRSSQTVIQREGVVRAVQTSATTPVRPKLHAIDAVANVDEVFDPSLPSAIPGETIELVGENFTYGTMIAFEIDSRPLRQRVRVNRKIGIEEFRVSQVSDDGTRARVTVPIDATSGTVRIAGQSDGVELQIVPKISIGIELRGDVAAAQRMLDSYTFLGISSDENEPFSLRIDDHIVLGCPVPLQADCQPLNDYRDAPMIQHSLELITLTGRDRIELPAPEPVERPWLIEGLDHFEKRFAAEYAYTGLTANTVLAGSRLHIQVQSSDAAGTAQMPEKLNFALRGHPESNRPSDFNRITGWRNDAGNYELNLPIDFRGGSLEIEPPLGAEPATPEEILQIDVAPTVIAASGDSVSVGSTILLSGTNFSDAVFTIDDIPISPQETPPFEKLGLDTVALMVPDGATDGVLSITDEGLAATLDRLVPWWPEAAMPTAEVGQATYASLPSANTGQRIEYSIDCLPGDHFDCQSEETLPASSNARILRTNRSIFIFYQRVVELTPDNRLLVQPQIDDRGPVMLFGDWSGRSFNLLPIVPEAAVRTYSAEVGRLSGSTEGWLEIDTKHVATQDGIEIRWDDQRWNASTFDQYHQSLEGDPSLERAARFDRTDEALIQRWPDWQSNVDTVLPSGIWLGRDNLQQLLSGPIAVSNGWGTHTIDYGDPVSAVDPILSELVATSGTPADPSLPSVNAGQQLVVPQQIFSLQDGIFFVKRHDPTSDDASQRANWTAAAKQVERHDHFEDDQYHVPYDAVTGMTRWGLFGSERPIQVVPTVEVYASSSSDLASLRVSMNGLDDGARLRFGDFSVALSPDEIRRGRFDYSPNDPRLAGVTAGDLAAGISVIDSGGQSEVVKMPTVTALLVNGVSPEQVDRPIRVRPGDEITLIGGNLKADSRGVLFNLETNSSSSAAIETVSVAEDGTSANLRIRESGDLYSLWDLRFDAWVNGTTADATWSLPESRLLILPGE